MDADFGPKCISAVRDMVTEMNLKDLVHASNKARGSARKARESALENFEADLGVDHLTFRNFKTSSEGPGALEVP